MNGIALLGLLLAATSTLMIGCGGGDSPSGAGGAASSSVGGSAPTSSVGGATSSSGGGTGGAAPIPGAGAGIQGCVAMFVEADGLCHPTLDKCPKGSIPRFDQGCVPAGIAACSSAFVEADGLCHVTMAKCPIGTFAVPSEGCIPIDGPVGCGAAPWGAIADGAGTIWVDPTYSGGGSDGSKAKPATTIAQGLALAPEGGRVALAAGNYPEAVQPTKSVEIVGRCPSMVKITGVAAFGAMTTATVGIGSTPAGVTLRNVLVVGGGGQGIAVEGAAAKATIDGVWVRNATEYALDATSSGAVVDVKHSLFEATLPTPAGTRGQGIVVQGGATMVVAASAVVNNVTEGAGSFNAGSKLTFTDGLIEGTAARKSDGLLGSGVLVGDTATATLTGVAIVANRFASVAVSGPGSKGDLSGCVVEKTTPQKSDGNFGMGVAADSGAKATIGGSAILGNLLEGVAAFGVDSDVTIEATLVAGTTPDLSDGNGGNGVYAGTGGFVHVLHSTVFGNSNVGILTQINVSAADVESSLIQGNGLGDLGAGIVVDVGSKATIDSSALAGNIGFGLVLSGDTSAILKRSLIAGTLPDSKGGNGLGVRASDAKSLQITASALLSNRAVGVLARGGQLAMSGSVVRGVKLGSIALKAVPSIEGIGDGVLVIPGTQPSLGATIDASLFEDCERAGILFANQGGSIHDAKATKNRFGLVLQGALAPLFGADSAFVGNTEKDQLLGGMLPVP